MFIYFRNEANANSVRRNGETPLHSASHSGNTKIVQMLLKGGALPDAIMKNGASSMHIAAQFGKDGVIRTLANTGGADTMCSMQIDTVIGPVCMEENGTEKR